MRAEVIDKMATLMAGAFGLVAALAWNSAVQAVVKRVFGEPDQLSALLIYAIIITIFAVVATYFIGRVAEKAKTAHIHLIRRGKQKTRTTGWLSFFFQ